MSNNIDDVAFATLDYPWKFPVCDFEDFNIARENEMRSVVGISIDISASLENFTQISPPL